jgi:hypothetical protein
MHYSLKTEVFSIVTNKNLFSNGLKRASKLGLKLLFFGHINLQPNRHKLIFARLITKILQKNQIIIFHTCLSAIDTEFTSIVNRSIV